jgi:thiol-disulfide isomerase/thioredoxin
VRASLLYATVAVAAVAAGAGLWWAERPVPRTGPVTISTAALYAAPFTDATGRTQTLGQFQGRAVVLNFWATWCAPCREEMPAFVRLHHRWKDRQVAFVGLSNEPPERVAGFAAELGIDYPLWTGGAQADELGRRLGNIMGVLPFTVLLDTSGRVVEAKVGPYSEAELEEKLVKLAGKG